MSYEYEQDYSRIELSNNAGFESYSQSTIQELNFNSNSNSGSNSNGNCKFLPPLELEKYKLNNDPNPEILKKRPNDKLRYVQEVQYKFLEPPAAPKPGDLVVKQLPNRQIAPAPPLVVKQTPPKPANPEPVVLREVPPQPPQKVSDKLVFVPGKVLAPPPRKVVIERLPNIPAKPQQVFLEKWLGIKQQKRKVVYQPSDPDCVIQNPKNLVIQWDNPEVEVNRAYKNLGTLQADPVDYVRQHGNNLLRHEEFVKNAANLGAPEPLVQSNSHRELGLPELEGDIEALRLVDLDRAGLAEYRNYLNNLGVRYDASRFSSSASQYGYVTSQEVTGLISMEQAQATLNNLNAGNEKPITENELKAYFNSIDSNGDGNISFEEFKDSIY